VVSVVVKYSDLSLCTPGISQYHQAVLRRWIVSRYAACREHAVQAAG
jgi:hypothetical protein